MAVVTTLATLSNFFNAKGSANYKPLREFAAEVKALSDEEKRELAEGICAITGDTLKPATAVL